MGTENTGTSQRVHHGHNIASARRMKGLVQKTLADLLGMSQQRLSQIESTKIVSDEILQKVAEITGVSLEDLKTMEEPMSIYIENNSTNTMKKGRMLVVSILPMMKTITTLRQPITLTQSTKSPNSMSVYLKPIKKRSRNWSNASPS